MQSESLPPLAHHMRSATKAAHHALDHHPVLAPLVAPRLDVADYARALAALHGPHGALEAALAGFAPADDFPVRLPALSADLAALGQPPVALEVAVPTAHSDAARIGLMYVLEGSILGACVIARQLTTSLPAAVPRRFLGSPGDPLRWSRFWSFAANRCARDRFAEAEAAADAAFAFYRAQLDRCSGPACLGI